ncbi:MAG: 6-phospho-3-hexuloisomerase [Peptostreptococcaceae bacterium]|jgi:6-phospho-3-hexuloisomerase|nr:6-phospho-3-hexuloisomerase [Peptostreptococcaceae bacterium]
MNDAQYLTKIIEELSKSAELISDLEVDRLSDQIIKSKKIFVTGAGRSGLMGKSFVMRMMHLGIDAYVVGETITPNFEDDDLLIIGTGSGETKTLIPIAKKAKSLGGTVVAVTISPESTIGKLSDFIVKLPGAPKDQSEGDYNTIQPMGSLFEQTMLLFYDATILSVMEKKRLDSNKMYGRHANLE